MNLLLKFYLLCIDYSVSTKKALKCHTLYIILQLTAKYLIQMSHIVYFVVSILVLLYNVYHNFAKRLLYIYNDFACNLLDQADVC